MSHSCTKLGTHEDQSQHQGDVVHEVLLPCASHGGIPPVGETYGLTLSMSVSGTGRLACEEINVWLRDDQAATRSRNYRVPVGNPSLSVETANTRK